jgi:hypothetical protein
MADASVAAGFAVTSIAARLGFRKLGARLIPQVYEEWWRGAGHSIRIGWVNYTLRVREPVREACVRLIQQPLIPSYGRGHFVVVFLRHAARTSLKRVLSRQP